jgi:hypothetical protein
MGLHLWRWLVRPFDAVPRGEAGLEVAQDLVAVPLGILVSGRFVSALQGLAVCCVGIHGLARYARCSRGYNFVARSGRSLHGLQDPRARYAPLDNTSCPLPARPRSVSISFAYDADLFD